LRKFLPEKRPATGRKELSTAPFGRNPPLDLFLHENCGFPLVASSKLRGPPNIEVPPYFPLTFPPLGQRPPRARRFSSGPPPRNDGKVPGSAKALSLLSVRNDVPIESLELFPPLHASPFFFFQKFTGVFNDPSLPLLFSGDAGPSPSLFFS